MADKMITLKLSLPADVIKIWLVKAAASLSRSALDPGTSPWKLIHLDYNLNNATITVVLELRITNILVLAVKWLRYSNKENNLFQYKIKFKIHYQRHLTLV